MTQHADLPRVIDTGNFFDARASEVHALQQVLSAAAGQTSTQQSSRRGRRRTTSYRSYRHTRRPNSKLQQPVEDAETAPTAEAATGATAPKPSGRSPSADAAPTAAQRPTSRAMRRRPGRLRAAAEQSCAAEPADPARPGEPLRKLETHLWHAKRMDMQERWGHLLPEGAVGKGHGSRHMLQQLHSGCLLHDASYWCPLQLAGSRVSLLAMLQATTEPGTAEALLSADGQVPREHYVMLHHPGQWPRGTIGPVNALLLPPQHAAEAAMPPTGGQAGPAAPARLQLWLWLHPAAYHEGLAALQRLCQPPEAAQQQRPQDAAPAGVTITPVSRHLRRLELRGPCSTRLLRELLPGARAPASPPAPAGTVLACQIQDPRLASCRGDADLDAAPSGRAGDGDAVMAEAAEVPPATAGPADLGLQHAACAAPHLWEGPNAVPPPHSESQISSWRRRRRLAELGLGAEPEPLSHVEPAAAATCPVLLIRRRTFGAAAAGYSLVVPALWVGPLWGELLRGGGVAVGQREWRWVAADQGCAAFPWDFPDSRAGAAAAADELAVHDAKRAKATKAKQLHVAPQWDCLAALPLQQPSAEPLQAAPSTAAISEGPAAMHAAAAAVDQQPADEQPAALVHPTAPTGNISAPGQAEPCCMDIDGGAPPAVTAAAAVADPGAAGSGSPGAVQAPQPASDDRGAAAALSLGGVASSLPPGWWVARSIAALLQAMAHTDAAAAAPQQRPPRGTAAAAAAAAAADAPAAAVAAAGAAPAPAAADSPAASAPGAGLPSQQAEEAAHLAPASTTQPAAGGAVDRLCLVRVRVHMAGRGVAQPGAAVCGPVVSTSSSSDAGEQQLIGFVMAPAVRGASAWAGATALCGAEALDRLWQQQQQGISRSSATRARQCRQQGINVALEHPATGELMPAQAFVALQGRAGDASF